LPIRHFSFVRCLLRCVDLRYLQCMASMRLVCKRLLSFDRLS